MLPIVRTVSILKLHEQSSVMSGLPLFMDMGNGGQSQAKIRTGYRPDLYNVPEFALNRKMAYI